MSLIYENPARYGEALLNVQCYHKSLIRRGPSWGRRGAVSVQGLVGGGGSQTLPLENGCIRPGFRTSHQSLRKEIEGVFILGYVY